jgi:hypothetical protein
LSTGLLAPSDGPGNGQEADDRFPAVYIPQPRNFSQGEIGFFEALAEMGALAIENVRMHE